MDSSNIIFAGIVGVERKLSEQMAPADSQEGATGSERMAIGVVHDHAGCHLVEWSVVSFIGAGWLVEPVNVAGDTLEVLAGSEPGAGDERGGRRGGEGAESGEEGREGDHCAWHDA